MANTFDILGNAGVNFLRSAGVIHVTLTCGDTYATATGGLPVDLRTAVLPFINAQNGGMPAASVVAGFGSSTLGWRADLTPVAATPGTFKMRLWNGITEKADGAITDVVELFLICGGG